MSAAPAAEAAPKPKGSKKLIIIIAAVVLVLAGGGGAAMMLMKKKAADAEAAEGEGESHAAAPKAATAKKDAHAAPTFVPLEAFTVNLADRDAERFAQVGITLEIDDPHLADQIKIYTPVIRNHILMAIADRTAAELMGREGKAKLATKVRKEVSRALGFEVDEDEDEADEEAEKPAKADAKKKKKKKKAAPELPIKAVHFSNFIIQ